MGRACTKIAKVGAENGGGNHSANIVSSADGDNGLAGERSAAAAAG